MSSSGTWRKSSRSAQFNCVEVALTSEDVAVRDSKNPDHDHLTVTHDQWRSFLRTLDTGHEPTLKPPRLQLVRPDSEGQP